MNKRIPFTVLLLSLLAVGIYLAAGRDTGPKVAPARIGAAGSVNNQLSNPDVLKSTGVGMTTAGDKKDSKAAIQSRDAVNAADDLFELMRSLAKAAYDGNAEAQLTIARAQIVCDLSLPFAANVPRHDSPGLEKLRRDAARCLRMKDNDPFAELPPKSGGYSSSYWLMRAAERGHSLAGVILSANTVQIALNEQPSKERQAKLDLIESRLKKAARANTPEHQYYIAQTLLLADTQLGASVPRGVAWYLTACRAGGCVDPLEPINWECPPGLGTSCELSIAASYYFETQLGTERYARAVELSYQIEDLMSKDMFDDLDLSLQ